MKQLKMFPPTFRGERGADAMGDGRFGASRGSRMHTGRDYKCEPGIGVISPCDGVVGRLGVCYGNKKLDNEPTFRLIEIQNESAVIRVLYLRPCVDVGDVVAIGDPIGHAQDLRERYGPTITPHVHVDVRLIHGALCGRGEPLDDVLWLDPALFMY